MGPNLMSTNTNTNTNTGPLTVHGRGRGLLTRDVGVRGALLLITVLLVAFHAPTWFATPMVVLAAGAVVQHVARRRRLGGVDAWLAGLGGLLVTLVLLALVLNLFPAGLNRISWSIGLGIVGALALAASAMAASTQVQPSPWRISAPGAVLRTSSWYAASVLVLVGALVISVHATNNSDRAPAALSVQRANGTTATVVVTSSRAAGPYSMVIDSGGATATLESDFRVTADAPVERSLTVPAGSRATIRLTDASSGATVRTVILDPR